MSAEFAEEIVTGLESSPKTMSSKYFYDEKGDALFQKIMQLPEYYLTNSEFEILTNQKTEILQSMINRQTPFQIVELGAGDGFKTKIMLRHLMEQKIEFTYVPVDISAHVLKELSDALEAELPGIKVESIAATYQQALENRAWNRNQPTLMLFLGSSLGNFSLKDGQGIIEMMANSLKPGDQLLMGLDLQKDPEVILAAYNDSQGVTREFNMNLLDRINKELQGDFNRAGFKHYPVYDPVEGAAKSYLISTEKQSVHFLGVGKTIEFSKGEPVYMEISQKYKLSDIQQMAEQHHLKVKKHYFDTNEYYVDSLWEKQ